MKKIILTLLLIPILSILTLAQAISIPITISDNANHSQVLYFGLDPLATDGIDLSFGESDLPPPPVVGAFDARFVLPQGSFNGTLNSWRDYRGATLPFAGQKEHRLKYQRGLPGDSIFITYNLPPYISLNLKDVITGTIINVNLSGSGVYAVSNPDVFSQLKCFVNYYKTLNLTALVQEFFRTATNDWYPDLVTAQLLETSSPWTTVLDQADINLDANGQGTGNFFIAADATNYYLVLKHRNSLETWSKNVVQFSGGTLTYDFTTAATQAYGDNLVLKGGKYCMWSGDITQDGSIDALDRSAAWNDRNLTGYQPSDVNGDGTVDALDRSICWNNRNIGKKWPGAPPLAKPIKIDENQLRSEE